MTRTVRPTRRRLTLAAAAATLAAGSLAVSSAAPAQAAEIREGNLATAVYKYTFAPNSTAGANDWNCKPSAENPNPVVMLPGTFFNHGANFIKIGPRLKNNGFCTFALNYGQTAASFGRVGGLGSIKDSAQQLDEFVTKVLKSTGAKKVDILGHSQGGNVPIWWIKKMGGASKTGNYVGWAPSSRGTDLNGLITLANGLGAMGFITGVSNVGQFPGVTDQANTSAYTKELFPDGSSDVPSGPKYTVIATEQDKVVTPYTRQTLSGSDVNNIVLQDKCPKDLAGHVGLFNDEPTMQMTLNAFKGGPKNFQPECRSYGVPLL
ncbi:alpha/beta fold hydrolase [Demetria terragena]|uniref:alpha/beta fold hydrolase n=1 Tax=Demetria terragena TaxID=63959 RepID=UPI0003787750|nr:alpha/beta fold hydrolase [Demetria terragena]